MRAISIALLFCFIGTVHAQSPTNNNRDEIWEYCKGLIRLAGEKIKPALEEKHHHLLGKMVVLPSKDFNAMATPEGIYVTIGVCIEVALTVDATLKLNTVLPASALREYVRYLVESRQKAGNIDLMTATKFFGLPVTPSTERDEALHELITVDSLLFLIAHELGHHVAGHVLSPSKSAAESRNRERQADLFAAQLLRGLKPSVAVPSIVVLFNFLNSDIYHAKASLPASHPEPECRIEFLTRYLGFWDEFKKDAKARAAVERHLRAPIEQAEAIMERTRKDCEANP
jgi:hypothetical protein